MLSINFSLMSLIKENNKYFQKSIKIAKMLYNEHLYEDCINQIEKSAQFAWLCFSGYYRSNISENLLNTIGSEIIYKESSLIKKNTSDSFKILHVCSTLYETGGHTKLLFNWIENDQENDHSLVSTRLNEEELLGLSRFYSKKSIEQKTENQKFRFAAGAEEY